MNHSPFSPAFSAAMRRYQRLEQDHGVDSIQARNAFTDAMQLAPQWFQDEAYEKAKEMGLIPEPDSYLEDGTPLVSLESIAKTHGISIEEAERTMNEMLEHRKAQGLSDVVTYDQSLIHRRQ